MKIVADSACDFSKEFISERSLNIDFVPLTLQLADSNFIDDDTLDIQKYLMQMEKCPVSAKTAAPPPELFLEKYKGDESVFVVTLSSHLSATYSNAVIAQKTYLEEIGKKFIHVFDSLSASVGESLIALKINDCSKNKLSDAEIVETVNKFIKNMKTYFLLERFDNLAKNGRMNPYIAKIASLLSIKPICAGVDGKIAMIDKARGYTNAVRKLVDIIAKEATDIENRTLGIAYVSCKSRAYHIRDEILKKVNFKDVLIFEAAGLCSTYADKDGVILSF